jgi:hypothetical protein
MKNSIAKISHSRPKGDLFFIEHYSADGILHNSLTRGGARPDSYRGLAYPGLPIYRPYWGLVKKKYFHID